MVVRESKYWFSQVTSPGLAEVNFVQSTPTSNFKIFIPTIFMLILITNQESMTSIIGKIIKLFISIEVLETLINVLKLLRV